jgi:hypothetical protein
MDHTFSPEDLARRRSQSKSLAWLIGGVVLLLYIAGFFLKR